jgi:hypothetical protein
MIESIIENYQKCLKHYLLFRILVKAMGHAAKAGTF